MHWLGYVVSAVGLAAAGGAASHLHVPQFHNAAEHAGADPYVFYDSNNGRYYAYSTEGADPGNYFAIYSSPDLSTWHKHRGGVLKTCYDADGKRLPGGQACWAGDWLWAPETYYNEKTGWYFFFFAGRLRPDMTKDYFRYSHFEEPSKLGVAVSRSPTGPFREIVSKPLDWYPFDPQYHDVNLIMDEQQMLPPQSQAQGQTAPKGTYIPTIDVNIFFDQDDRIYLYASRNAYRNWNWDAKLKKYIEESNIIVVELERDWWDDPKASTMPEIISSQVNVHSRDAPLVPSNITSYNGTGEIGHPPRMDGWKTVISYGADPQDWENYHVDDYRKYNGTRKDRRWSEGSTLITRPATKRGGGGGGGGGGEPIYLLTYSANNFEAAYYGVGFATAKSPLGPFRKSSKNPVLSQQEANGQVPVYSTGHGSIVASPPRRSSKSARTGPQEVTVRTPPGSELFYVHHARNNTSNARSIYTTRMTLDETSISFPSDDAISMHLTALDEPLPKNTYPISVDAICFLGKRDKKKIHVRVSSKQGAAFDLEEGTNRMLALPGDVSPLSVTAYGKEGSFWEMEFDVDRLQAVAYQRQMRDGSWSTVAAKKISCH